MSDSQTKTYRNIMETLVTQEVNRQLRKVAPNLAQYIDRVEVTTYALNRLPPLYASSAEGLHQQQQRGEQQFGEQIVTAVRQAIAAVERDPLRVSTPLMPEKGTEYHDAYVALKELEDLLQQGELSWRNLPSTVRQTLADALSGDLSPQQIEKIKRRHRKYDRYRGL
jgi:hypothetical protein